MLKVALHLIELQLLELTDLVLKSTHLFTLVFSHCNCPIHITVLAVGLKCYVFNKDYLQASQEQRVGLLV